MQKSRGYAPGLAWVRFNQKLAFHLGDTIIETPSFPMLQMIPSIHRRSYYDMQCDAEMMQQLINKATTTLNTEYILGTNKLALRTNALIFISISSRKCHLPTSVLVIQFQGVSLFHLFDLLYSK